MADTTWYLDDGTDFSNVRAQMRVVTVEDSSTTAGVALRFRRTDEDNWWEFGHSPDNIEYVLRKNVAGTLYKISEPGTVRNDGDLIKVEAYEERINCYVNQRLVASVIDSDLINGTDVGIRFSETVVDSEVDSFYALQLVEDIRPNMGYYPDYQVLVDWDNDGGLNLGGFENDSAVLAWESSGSRPATLESSDEQVFSGHASLKFTWTNYNMFQFDISGHGFSQGQFGGDEFINPPNSFKFNQAGQGFDQGVFAATRVETSPTLDSPEIVRTIEKLEPGREYYLNAWFFIPTGSTHVTLSIAGISPGVTTTLNDQWEEVTFNYTATAESHDILITPVASNPDTGDYGYLDEIMNLVGNEDITCYILGDQTPMEFRTGRDEARSLASISPGEVQLDCDNNTQIFSPDNPGSSLYGLLEPGKPVVIRAKYNNHMTRLFNGFIDNYILHPEEEDRYVTFSCMDALQYLANATLSTELYPSIQTGQAVEVILDAVGWPEDKRSVEAGATTIRWWWEEDTDGLTAIQRLVQAEGIPSMAYVDDFGNFVFSSRHHRLIQSKSEVAQVGYKADPDFDEPLFSAPFTYDIGWKDIINRVDVAIKERQLKVLDEVWSDDSLLVIPAGQTKSIKVKASTAFYAAEQPSIGYENVLDFDEDTGKDIVLKTGSGTISSVNLTRTSGQATEMQITAGGSDVTIKRLALRAMAVEDLDERKVFQEDSTSVTKYGPKNVDTDFPWINVNDMEAVAQIVLGTRAERLPVVHMTLNNGHPVRIGSIMETQIHERIHIAEALQTFVNDDFYVETIDHKISKNGKFHEMMLGCEKARDQRVVIPDEEPIPVFTFDVAGRGFDDGYFQSGGTGLSLSENLFILDQSNLDEDGLGY